MLTHPKKARDRQRNTAQLNLNLSTGQLGKQAKPQQPVVYDGRRKASIAGNLRKAGRKPGGIGPPGPIYKKDQAGSGLPRQTSIAPLARNPWNTLIPKEEILLGKAHLSLNHPLWKDNEIMPKMRRPYTSPQ